MSGLGDNPNPAGQQQPSDTSSPYNTLVFVIQQALALLSIATPVQVIGVDAEQCTVDVQLLVNLLDGQNVATPRGQVFGLPYFRNQGGPNGIILDPHVGDRGDAIFCDRDISGVKSNWAASSPGSLRRFSKSDGIYFGGILNSAPTNYIQFGDGTLTLSPDNGATYIKLEAGKITLFADELVLHAVLKNSRDAGGTGDVIQPAQIDTYTDGVPSSHHAPDPPGPLS